MRQPEEKIRRRAYQLWEAEGRPDGRHAEHWAQAEREVLTGGESARWETGGIESPNLSAVAEGMWENADGPVSPDGGARGHVAKARRRDATG